MPTPESWAYADGWEDDSEVIREARERAAELDCPPLSRPAAALLRLLAASVNAQAVVEVGTGAGVSGAALLSGMTSAGVLTSIDVEAEHQRLARQTYAEAGVPASRTRLITGRALDVLSRLTDGAYDLVFCDADKREYADYLAQALRLLRPGGIVAFDGALWHGLAADPANGDPETLAVRELATAVRDDARLTPVLLPAGDGLLVAAVATSHPIGEG